VCVLSSPRGSLPESQGPVRAVDPGPHPRVKGRGIDTAAKRCRMRSKNRPQHQANQRRISQMKRLSMLVIGLAALALGACSSMSSGSGWTVLFDGSNLDNWNAIGNANWRLTGGAGLADSRDKRQGFLVSKNSYTDFQVRAEFCVDDDANSGVFIRCPDTQK